MTASRSQLTLGRTLVYLVSFAAVAIWLVPLFWMILTSLKPDGSAVTVLTELIKPPFTLDNFRFVSSSASIWRWTWNSTVIAVVTTLGTLVLTSDGCVCFVALEVPR